MREDVWDVVIVGSGIAGLSRAWVALQRGLSVALLESGVDGHAPAEAGLILQNGLPPQLLPLTRPSRERWHRIPTARAQSAGLSLLQRDELEAKVLRECLTGAVRHANPAPGWSFEELAHGDLQLALRTLKHWLSQHIDYFPGRTILAVEKGCVYTLNGTMRADRVVVTADACSQWLPHEWQNTEETVAMGNPASFDLERTRALANAMHAAPGIATTQH